MAELPSLCAPGAVVVWTRHRRAPDLTGRIRGWFGDAGFEELGFDAPAEHRFGVGANRLVGPPAEFRSGLRLFNFVGDGYLPA